MIKSYSMKSFWNAILKPPDVHYLLYEYLVLLFISRKKFLEMNFLFQGSIIKSVLFVAR